MKQAKERRPKTISSLARAVRLAGILLLFWPAGDIPAQDKPESDPALENASFDEQSLALRTALHYDPSLEAPIKSLVALYQKADRIEELIGLYRAHIAQYPDDPGAKAVLIQILQKLNRAESDEMIQAAAQQHPENSLVQYLLYEYRARRQDERALESLSQAINLETKIGRRDALLELLLEEAGEGADRAMAEGHLEKIRGAYGHTVETLLNLADRMHRFGFNKLAMAALADASKKEPSPEAGVEIEVLAAKAQAALGDRTGAGGRLESLIERLAPDYWRRSEIMSLRINLLSSDAERKRLLTEARIRFEANPELESAVLEYAELLYASEERTEAAKVLIGACELLPNSERIQAEALKVLDRLGDDQKLWDFLTARLELFPDSRDLRYRLIKSAYLLGKSERADEELEFVLEKLEDAEERERLILDLARFLRRVSLNKEAAKLFEAVLAEDPGRFDVRRELSETHLANENPLSAALALRDLPVADAAIENFIDLIQFMMQNEFLLEAQGALEARLEIEPDSFELRLFLVDVLGKTGDRKRAEALLLEARKLADTPARYGKWLETGLVVYELFDGAGEFFDNEQTRFFEGNGGEKIEWTPDQVDRFLAFCEIGKESRLEGRVTQALRNQLAEGGLPADLRVKLRNLLVKALEKSPDHAAEVEEQLKLLAEEDTAHADEYQLRRGLLYHTMHRPDLAQESMAEVKIENVRDTGVLRAAAQVLVEYGMFDKARACLEGVSTQDPADLNNWERRMTLLAATGREDDLRKAIRHLLAGVDQIDLSPDSLEALQMHLLDSYWRTIARLLADGSPESMAEIFPFLEGVERETLKPQDRLWSLWVRAYTLNALNRNDDDRDAAIEQLIQLAGTTGDAGAEPAISFPDGLTVTVRAAVELLREPPDSEPEETPEEEQNGPLGRLEMAWAFESDPDSRILQMEQIPGGLLVLDDRGTVYRIDGSSGKLLWRERFGLPEDSRRSGNGTGGVTGISGGGLTISNRYYQVNQQGASIQVQQLVAPYRTASIGPAGTAGAGSAKQTAAPDVSGVKLARRFETDGGRFYLPFENEIQARSVEDGALIWAASLGSSGRETAKSNLPALARPGMHLSVEQGRVLAFFPRTGVAGCFDTEGGKLLWKRDVPVSGETARTAGPGGRLFSLNTGAAFSPGRMLVYGGRSLILDSATGQVIWSFEGGDVRAFPVELAEAGREERNSEPAAGSASPALTVALPKPGLLDHLSIPGDRPEAVKSFLQYRGALVAPAVHWSGERLSEDAAAFAVVDSGRVLLMGSGGVRQISLRLPLASRQFAIRGVFLGLAGSRAWFLNGDGLIKIDLNDGEVVRIQMNGFAGDSEASAVLSGSRVYVAGERGVAVLNAYSGGRIPELAWPEEFEAYRGKAAGEGPSTREEIEFAWQGIIRHNPGLPSYCFPIIDRVAGSYLFTRVGESRIAALRTPPAAQP